MKNWDDLRFFLAVAQGGSITAGANFLGVDQSTVSRRIHAYEGQLGRKLFYDTKKRNQLTQFGEACLTSALKIKEEMSRMDQALRVGDDGFKGTISVHTEGALSSRLLLSVVSGFLDNYPALNLRISDANNSAANFRADVGIYTTNTPDPDHFGRRLATATFASYANAEYLERFRAHKENMSWLNWDDGSNFPTWPRLSPAISDEYCRMRTTSVASLIEGSKLGLGATILPCFIGELENSLSRVEPGKIVSQRDVWVFVQPDIRNIPKIRIFLDHLYSKINEVKHLIETDI